MFQLITSKKDSTDSAVETLMKKQLLWMLLLRVVLYTLLLGTTYFLNEMEFGYITLPNSVMVFLLVSVYSISIISALILRNKTIRLQRFGFIQSILDTFIASALVYFTGISSSIFSSVFFFSIITGGLILPRRGGFLAAATATFLYGGILYLEYLNLVPGYFFVFEHYQTERLIELINLFAIKGFTFFLAALLSALFGIRLASTEEVLSSTIQSFDKLSHLYKTIFDNISTGIITTNDENIITSANNAARTITGFSLSDMIGTNILILFPNIDVSSKNARLAIDFTKKDGSKIRIGYSIASLNIPKNEEPSPQVHSHHEEDSKLITLQDISEVEKLERKIRQGEKMAAIGMMSAGIAHDFRNPLTAISGSAQVLAKEFNSSLVSDSSENLELTHIILRESNRLISTISDFLKFARPDSAQRQWFSLRNCLEEVLQVCRADPNWPETCYVQIYVDANTDIWADEKQFFTVMSHLIQNAVVFCPPGDEKIVITAQEIQQNENKEMLAITVEDNGSGIPDDLYDKVFEPFYTKRADGTGLGLAIVNQTIEAHKGSINISRSSLGGAQFTITLPIF